MDIKPLVLFDLDWTLFDISKLKPSLYILLSTICKAKTSDMKEEFEQYISTLESRTDFSIEELTERIAMKYLVPQTTVVTAFTNNAQIYSLSLYPEVISSIKTLSSKYTLGIFSEGTHLWQSTKLTHSGLLPFFQKEYIFILRRKCDQNSLKKIPDNTIIVDDNITVCETLHNERKTIPIWLNRNSDKVSPAFKTIHNLVELNAVLQSV